MSNNRELQIKGSLNIIEKHVKDLKINVNNYFLQCNLSKKSGTRIYQSSSKYIKPGVGGKSMETSLSQTKFMLNSLKKEVDKIILYLQDQDMVTLNNTTMNESIRTTIPMMHPSNNSQIRSGKICENSINRQQSKIISYSNTSKLVKQSTQNINFKQPTYRLPAPKNLNISSKNQTNAYVPNANMSSPYVPISQPQRSQNLIPKPTLKDKSVERNKSIISSYLNNSLKRTPSNTPSFIFMKRDDENDKKRFNENPSNMILTTNFTPIQKTKNTLFDTTNKQNVLKNDISNLLNKFENVQNKHEKSYFIQSNENINPHNNIITKSENNNGELSNLLAKTNI